MIYDDTIQICTTTNTANFVRLVFALWIIVQTEQSSGVDTSMFDLICGMHFGSLISSLIFSLLFCGSESFSL